ncbi:MAG: hypothetical protein AAFN74_07675 [Myxococcota bacterium]
MKLEADARIAFARPVVYAAYRDRLPEMLPYLPNIKAITVEKREEAGEGITKLLNLWEAKGDVPKVAQRIITPDMFAWHDHASWNQNDWTCDWRIETRMFTEKVNCSGHNEYIEDGDGTILKIRGNLDMDLKGIPGVPSFLAGTVRPHVEKFIVDLLTPNLLSIADGLEKFLKDQQG